MAYLDRVDVVPGRTSEDSRCVPIHPEAELVLGLCEATAFGFSSFDRV